MFSKLDTSWQMMKQSVYVMAHNKKLLLFPVLSFLAIVFIALFFLGGFLFQSIGHSDTPAFQALSQKILTQSSNINQATGAGQRSQPELNSTGVIWMAGIYFLSMFLATFFNVAYYHEIMEAIHERPVSISSGFSFAISHLKPIIMWSLLAGLVGYLIKAAERRMGLLGRIVTQTIGLAWSVAAVFVIPVIVTSNESNPFELLKISASTLKKTWGESLVGFVGSQTLGVLIVICSGLIFGVIGMIGITQNTPIIIMSAIAGWILFIFAYSYFASIAMNIYQCVLYRYASTGEISNGYTQDMMHMAWQHRKI